MSICCRGKSDTKRDVGFDVNISLQRNSLINCCTATDSVEIFIKIWDDKRGLKLTQKIIQNALYFLRVRLMACVYDQPTCLS